jgi:hypothetical protein
MKKYFVILIILFGIIIKSYSNDTIKNLLIISNDKIGYDDFSIKYGRKMFDNYWIKFGVIYSGKHQIEDPKTSSTFKRINDENNFGIIIGIDRVNYTKMKNIDFVFGSNMRFNLINYSEITENPMIIEENRKRTNKYYNFGLGLNFTLYYNFSDNFSIGSEINPYVMYNFYDDKGSLNKLHGFTYKLNNTSLISLRYKW